MQNGDKVMVYTSNNRYHECTYIGESPNKGHHIIYRNEKPYECSIEMIKQVEN